MPRTHSIKLSFDGKLINDSNAFFLSETEKGNPRNAGRLNSSARKEVADIQPHTEIDVQFVSDGGLRVDRLLISTGRRKDGRWKRLTATRE
jgi:hypothetical protein